MHFYAPPPYPSKRQISGREEETRHKEDNGGFLLYVLGCHFKEIALLYVIALRHLKNKVVSDNPHWPVLAADVVISSCHILFFDV